MSHSIPFVPGEFYHLYNRGTEKREIFLDNTDRERLLVLLYLCNNAAPVDLKSQGRTLEEIAKIKRENTLVDIAMYCFMPNHFHLLVRAKDEKGVSRFMQKMLTAYTMYFNKKYERTGALFQGKFKAKQVSGDNYLKYLISYIHLNPIKILDPQWKENGIKDRIQAKEFLHSYTYSSYLDYISSSPRLHGKILNMEVLPTYSESKEDFENMVTEWLDYHKLD